MFSNLFRGKIGVSFGDTLSKEQFNKIMKEYPQKGIGSPYKQDKHPDIKAPIKLREKFLKGKSLY